MQYSVEHWYDDGEGTEGSCDSGLTQDQAWLIFSGQLPHLADEDERMFIFRRERPGRGREVIAQAWVDHHGERQVRVSAGYTPAVPLRVAGL